MRYLAFRGAGGGGTTPTGDHELYPDGTPLKYGHSCDASRDGSTVAISDQEYEKVWIFTDPDADGSWPLQETISSPDTALTLFGSGVGLSADGNILAVTAQYSASPNGGAICIYDRSGGVWTHTETLDLPTDTRTWLLPPYCTGPVFSDDGSRLFAGDPDALDDSFNSGIGFTWLRSGGAYTMEEILYPGVTGFEGLGLTTDTDSTGTYTAISKQYAGFMTVRKRTGTSWADEQDIYDSFTPTKVMLTADGATLVIINYLGTGNTTHTRSGTTWTNVDTFDIAASIGSGLQTTWPNRIADLSSDGSVMVIGAHAATVSGNTMAGKLIPFSGSAAVYTEGTEMTMPGGAVTNAEFGFACALPGDGSFVVVTAPGATGVGGTGRAWIIYL